MTHPPATGPALNWALRPATAADLEPLVELRAVVMRPDLERLGRYDAHRVRQRLRDSFSPAHTQIIEVDTGFAGSITVRPATAARWLEHFYLNPRHQGRGLGTAVLGTVLATADADQATVRLNVLQGSPARNLYERHGFVVDSEDPVDVFMIRKFL
ncbi:GNAT superfamily N-acetyltransferase [Kribbella aluminosa]|uniref:GNAT superfamily N-acetyltransferase n=1 Tax=Kribbella aluminosa TaxID=416017 RepID=A0ABS4UP94_9ACTN|nr:GNAT family N-acetyltransferase [Kribbella aluminosa]MBP2353457.1 GNAT superfamily N-acetyltransferase [Kribbella aluminosa]